MKLLHSADWHLDAPLVGFTSQQQAFLRAALLSVPGRIATLCRQENCDLLLLAGDLFDGPYTRDSYQAVYRALEEVQIPVLICPGNHDFLSVDSPWKREVWPENVCIFSKPYISEYTVSGCRVFGAGYTAMDAPAMLEGFHAQPGDLPAIGLLHADPTQATSPYCPVTRKQIQDSGLQYLALGHIHKQGSVRCGDTLSAWPGCPMGRGYDEPEEKGVLVVTLEDTVTTRFVSLDLPRFFDWEVEAGYDPAAAIASLLPAAASRDFYRITLTGPAVSPDTDALLAQFSQYPHLTLRDRTTPPTDPWATAGEDSFEGMYFSLLQEAMDDPDPAQKRIVELAARISRQLLDGQEVHLP